MVGESEQSVDGVAGRTPVELQLLTLRFTADLGCAPDLSRAWSHAPTLVTALAQVEAVTRRTHQLPPSLKRLAALRASELRSCSACVAVYRGAIALSSERREALANLTVDESLFTSTELLALRLAEELTLTGRASEASLVEATQKLGPLAAVELIATIALLSFDQAAQGDGP